MSNRDPWSNPGFIYLLHFDESIGGEGRKSARHYLGFVEGADPANIVRRLERHRKGDGAKITSYVARMGVRMTITRVWIGDRHKERRMHKTGKHKRWCPVCRKQQELARRTTLGLAVPTE